MLRTALLAIGLALALPGFAAAQNPISSRDVLRDDLNGLTGQETIMQVVEIAPGGVVPWHTHPDGHEISYVMEGGLTLEVDGQPKRSLKAGEGFHIQPGQPHSARNETADKTRIVVVRLNAKGKPIAVPFSR